MYVLIVIIVANVINLKDIGNKEACVHCVQKNVKHAKTQILPDVFLVKMNLLAFTITNVLKLLLIIITISLEVRNVLNAFKIAKIAKTLQHVTNVNEDFSFTQKIILQHVGVGMHVLYQTVKIVFLGRLPHAKHAKLDSYCKIQLVYQVVVKGISYIKIPVNVLKHVQQNTLMGAIKNATNAWKVA